MPKVEYIGKLMRPFGGRAAGVKFRVEAHGLTSSGRRMVTVYDPDLKRQVQELPEAVADELVNLLPTMYVRLETKSPGKPKAAEPAPAEPAEPAKD